MEKNCRIICTDISSEPSEHSGLRNYAIALSCITCGLSQSLDIRNQVDQHLALESAKAIMSDYYCPLNDTIDNE